MLLYVASNMRIQTTWYLVTHWWCCHTLYFLEAEFVSRVTRASPPHDYLPQLVDLNM